MRLIEKHSNTYELRWHSLRRRFRAKTDGQKIFSHNASIILLFLIYVFFLFVTQCGTAWSVSHAPQVDAWLVMAFFFFGSCWLCFRHQLTYRHGLKRSWISLWRFNQVLRSDFSVAYQESVSDHLLDWQPIKSGSSPPGETPRVTVCLLRRTVFFFHWQSMTLTLSISELCRTGLKNNHFNYEGIFVFCFRKKKRGRRKHTA